MIEIPLNFLIGRRVNPIKLEKMDIDIPGMDFYTKKPLKRKRKRIIISAVGLRIIRITSYLINRLKSDPENLDLGYEIERILREQNSP